MTIALTISVIICTSNRASDLRQTLSSLADVCVPGEMPTELIVVDNASTDDTAEVVKSCCLPNMSVRYIHEPRQGKGYAYNTGLAAAGGEIIILTDDDVRPPNNWLEGMVRPILDGRADLVAGGVTIAKHLQREWMKPSHKDLLASTENFDTLHPVGALGANMAFSRDVLTKIPAFDVELGPGALGFCDDNLFSNQAKHAGYVIASAFHASVEHHFDPARLTHASWLKRAVKQGQSGAYLAHHWEHQEIPDVRLRIIKRSLRLLQSRWLYQSECRIQEGIPVWEMDIVGSLAFYKQFLIERQKPRNYEKHGLVKRSTL